MKLKYYYGSFTDTVNFEGFIISGKWFTFCRELLTVLIMAVILNNVKIAAVVVFLAFSIGWELLNGLLHSHYLFDERGGDIISVIAGGFGILSGLGVMFLFGVG